MPYKCIWHLQRTAVSRRWPAVLALSHRVCQRCDVFGGRQWRSKRCCLCVRRIEPKGAAHGCNGFIRV